MHSQTKRQVQHVHVHILKNLNCNYKYMCIVTIVTILNDDIINILTMKSLIKFNL